MLTRALLGCLLLLAAAPTVSAQKRRLDPKRIAPNQERLVLEERSPLSPLTEQTKRLRWDEATRNNPQATYALEKESFQVYLPRRYRKKRTYGLLVWLSPGPYGIIPPMWEKTLDRRKLIAVGANEADNERHVAVRVGLALDAAHALQKRHSIDPRRVYVAGFSGGGNVSTFLTLHYPELFQGGIYIGGCQYFRNVPIPDIPGSFWRGGIPAPSAERLKLVKTRTRHVFLCGALDPVLPQMEQVVRLARDEDGFERVSWMKVPKLGHQLPKAHRLDRALRFLDKKKKKKKKKKEKKSP